MTPQNNNTFSYSFDFIWYLYYKLLSSLGNLWKMAMWSAGNMYYALLRATYDYTMFYLKQKLFDAEPLYGEWLTS